MVEAVNDRKCPRCAEPLTKHAVDGFRGHGCHACGGMWLDNSASQQVVTALPDNAHALAAQVSAAAASGVDTDGQNLSCPECDATLTRTRVKNAWLDVDICQRHGTWFDRGEIIRVARAANLPPSDWRATPKAKAVAPKPMTRGDSEADLQPPLIKNTYLRGFFNIFREMIDGAAEAEWEVELGGDDW